MCEKDSCIRFPRHIVMEILIYLYLYSVGVVRVDSKLPSASADSSLGLFDYEDSMDTAEVVFVTAVSGGGVKLPCAVESPSPAHSTVRLMLWYKDGSGVPFFSYDMRNRAKNGKRQAGHDSLGNRSSMTSLSRESHLTSSISGGQTTTPALQINRLQLKDGGMFRCRVDFKSTPTLNARVNLTVIVAPSRISLITESGQIVESSWGPLDQYQKASIICRSQGHPGPNVTWWRNNKLLPMMWTSKNDWSQNVLTLHNVTREDLSAKLQCRAANTHQRPPIVQNIQLDINLPPTSVKIAESSAESTLSAGKTASITCHVTGSRPSPTIRWSQNGRPITDNITENITENYTISEYRFVPTIADSGTNLQCSASNTALPQHTLNDSIKLSVNFKPVLQLRAGRTLNLANIKQNDDVYFECEITARPPIFAIDWLFENKSISSMSSSTWPGVVISGRSLAVQHVQRNSSGRYSCWAANSEGAAISNTVTLDVKHAPMCATSISRAVAVTRFQPAIIECQVLANPASSLTFTWTFNNTGDTQTLPEDNFSTNATRTGGSSILNYEVRSELDYGTLQCSASNSIGTQQRPCLVHVLPAGAPDRPSNCQLLNQSSTSVYVTCSVDLSYDLVGDLDDLNDLDDQDGSSGSQPSTLLFFLEVVGPDGAVHFNQTRVGVPAFTVTGLQPSTHYQLVLYAFNGKGRSEAVLLSTETLQEKAQRRTEQIIDGHFKESWSAWMTSLPLAAIVIAVSFGVVASICVTTLVVRQRRQKRRTPAISESCGISVDTTSSLYPAAASASASGPPLGDPYTTLTRLLTHTQAPANSNSDIILLQNRPMSFDCPVHTTGTRYYDTLSKVSSNAASTPLTADSSRQILVNASLPRRSPYNRRKQLLTTPNNDPSCIQLRQSKSSDSTTSCTTLQRTSCLKADDYCPVSPLDGANNLSTRSCSMCVNGEVQGLPAPSEHVNNSSLITPFNSSMDELSCTRHPEQIAELGSS